MISQTAEYALRAMVCLASREGEALPGHVIAQITQVPASYLHKIMKQLVHAELVSSQRGPSGGFRLTRPSTKITVLDVIMAVDPIKRISHCPLNLPEHAHSLCPLHRRIDDTIGQACDAFSQTSLQSMIENQS